jgi:hypothetical protein
MLLAAKVEDDHTSESTKYFVVYLGAIKRKAEKKAIVHWLVEKKSLLLCDSSLDVGIPEIDFTLLNFFEESLYVLILSDLRATNP